MLAIVPGCFQTICSTLLIFICYSTFRWGAASPQSVMLFALTARAANDTIIVEMIEHMLLNSTKNLTVCYNFYGELYYNARIT
jgi:hypothetical protein